MNHPKVYFHCCDDQEEIFQDDIIPLAEGLRELGIPFFSRANYWRQSLEPGDFLFRATPGVRPEECDLVVVPSGWFHWWRVGDREVTRHPFPEFIRHKKRPFVAVMIDSLDGHRTVSWNEEFRHFDLILRVKLNLRAWHPANLSPWALGLSNRMLAATNELLPWGGRRRAIFLSYNASHPFPHGSRTAAIEKLHPRLDSMLPTWQPPFVDVKTPPADPLEALYWRQTTGRHSPEYYRRLGSVMACSAFCGELIPPMPFRNPECYLVGGNKAKLRLKFYETLARFDPRPPRIVSCDSFRFWETLAAGTVAFNVDLERYGVRLPVMPENWKHYIGVNFDRVDDDIERLRSDPGSLERIGAAGRAWALENYSPKAVAKRFLETVGSPLS
jgi:hypothetical protein